MRFTFGTREGFKPTCSENKQNSDFDYYMKSVVGRVNQHSPYDPLICKMCKSNEWVVLFHKSNDHCVYIRCNKCQDEVRISKAKSERIGFKTI